MLVLGLNAFNHDSSIALIKDGELIYHELTEDPTNALSYGKPDHIAYYEKPILKKFRHLYAGQYNHAFTLKDLPSRHLVNIGLGGIPVHYVSHHLSHAVSAHHQTNFGSCCILVADAIGEWETVTLWNYDGEYTKILSRKYPYSLGIFYSAFSKLLGFKPMKEEGKLMQLSVDGNSSVYYNDVKQRLMTNLHRGVHGWGEIKSPANIASSVQRVFEEELETYLQVAKKYSNKLVFTGGCAYNTLSHRVVEKHFPEYRIPKYPGDAGSSIGAAKYIFKKLDKNSVLR